MISLLLIALLLISSILALFWWRLRPYRGGRLIVFAVLFMLPWLALPLYLAIGHPQSLSVQPPPQPSLDEAIARLEKRLGQNPQDLEGWLLLARSHQVLGRWLEAARSYEQALKLAPFDLNIKARYAEALAAAQDGDFSGKPRRLIEEILQINHDHPYALWLAGLDALKRGEKRRAAELLNRLLVQMPPESEAAKQLRQLMQRQGLALSEEALESVSTPTKSPKIEVTVKLTPGLQEQIPPRAMLLVFARAVSGPKVPLAVVRQPLEELPTQITLSDRQVLLPQFKLSRFKQVVVIARISRSGQAEPQPGDLEGRTGPVQLGEAVEVVIDRKIGS